MRGFFGIDLMISRDRMPFLIEFNGIESGFDDFDDIYRDGRVDDEVFGRMIRAASGGMIFINNNYGYDNILEYYAKLADAPFCKFNCLGEARRQNPGRVGLVVGMKHNYSGIEGIPEQRILNPFGVERMTEDKALTAFALARSFPENIPRTADSGRTAQVRELLDALPDNALLVHKPTFGAYGEGLDVFRKRDFCLSDCCGNYILQEAVQPIPVKCSRTGKLHGGCARVVYYHGFIDAYWRLASKPLSRGIAECGSQLVASPTHGEIVQPMEDRHKEILRGFAGRIVPAYEDFISRQRINSHACLERLRKKYHAMRCRA